MSHFQPYIESRAIETSAGNDRKVNPMNQLRDVLLVDPQRLVRFAIKSLIDSLDGYRVVGEADSVSEALRLVEQLKPDLVISEIALPGPSGLELLLEIQRSGLTDTHCLVLSHINAGNIIRQALETGAYSYVLKSDDFEHLVRALDRERQNSQYLPPETKLLVDSLPESQQPKTLDTEDPLVSLSPREREIFHLLASGMQNTAIAKQLYISPRTVETHRARIVRKLGFSSNGELIRFAIKHGLTVV